MIVDASCSLILSLSFFHRFLLLNMRLYVEPDVRHFCVNIFVIYVASSSRRRHLLFSATVYVVYHVIYDASRRRIISLSFVCVCCCGLIRVEKSQHLFVVF